MPGNNPRRGQLVCLGLMAVLAVLFWAQTACAMPRMQLPTIPERQTSLYHESFDEAYFPGETDCQLVIAGWGVLEESWSGFALQRMGEPVTPFMVPALGANGQTNIASASGGALRLWVKPYWSSGAGIGTATLLEMDAFSGFASAYAWSLQISADGNTVELFKQTDAGVQEVLQASISWQAGTSHNVVLNFSPQGSALFLDGVLAAQGTGLSSVPPSVGQLVLGSAISGTNSAGADLEEFYSFGKWLTEGDISLYLCFTASGAALGPISDEQQAAWNQPRAGLAQNSILSPGNVYDPNNATPCSPGGPFYTTNVAATLQTNGLTAVSFDIFGGTNGVFMDIFRMGNLNDSPPPIRTWIGQGMTCSTYYFTNQPAAQAFYELELPSETMTVAWGDNTYGQCEVPFGLSNAIAVAAGGYFSLALLNNGTVMGWGDNQYGQTNIPAGLTNVVSIAAGYLHGVALLADGSVTNWGYYEDGDATLCSVTNRIMATAPPTSGVVAAAA